VCGAIDRNLKFCQEMISKADRMPQEKTTDKRRFIQPHAPDKQSGIRCSPDCGEERYQGTGKLPGQVAIITAGDSGIGRAVAIAFAREGADVVIAYLDQHGAAEETRRWVEKAGRRCLTFAGEVGNPLFCRWLVEETVRRFGRLDILVNNAAQPGQVEDPGEITSEEVDRTFMTNIFSYFHCTTAAVRKMKKGASIINTTAGVAFEGHGQLITYSATKGASIAFTRSMATALLPRGIRVNGVEPGPVPAPLAAAAFPDRGSMDGAGERSPMNRRAQQQFETAAAYVYLASTDSAFMSGRVLHLNGGMIGGE